MGLREIKRRASRHTLIHRDSYSGPKSTAASMPGTPNEQPADSLESRLINIEQSLFEVSTRLARTEERNSYLSARCQAAVEGFSRCHQVGGLTRRERPLFLTKTTTAHLGHRPIDCPSVFSRFIAHAGRYAEMPFVFALSFFIHSLTWVETVQSLQREIERHSHALEEPRDMLREAPTFSIDNVPLSPRQRPVEDDSRRSSFSGPTRPGYFRPPAPPHLSQPPRRLASSIAGSGSGSGSPNSLRPQRDPQQPIPHPLSQNLQSELPPNHTVRRHTSADIRQHGWQVNSPFSGIGQTPHWPPSPNKLSHDYRDGAYEMPHQPRPSLFASQITPPLAEGMGGSSSSSNDSAPWGNFGIKYPPAREGGHTAPPTRRPSLAASSVHALLNPCEPSLEREREREREREGISDGEPDERKRRRM